MARRRYELTDEQFERIENALPEADGRGRPYEDHQKVINGIFWVLRSGAPWRDLPERYGSWKTVYDRFRRWAEDGTLQSIVEKLQGELDAEGHIDWGQFNVDSTIVQQWIVQQSVPAARQPVGQPTIKRGPSRPRGRGSKPCSRIRPGRILHQNASCSRRRWTSDGGGSFGRTAPRIGLFHRRNGPSSGAEAGWTAQKAA